MPNFYDDWLGLWNKIEIEKKNAKKLICPSELEWVRTRQDFETALLVAPETGFRTWGTSTMISEIPSGWHTGEHSHGEEGIYIVSGSGFSVVNGQRYDWEDGSCIKIPFGAVHQHFNTGDDPVVYFSAMAPQLEYLCGLSRFQQFKDCGETETLPSNAVYKGDLDSQGRRIVLRAKDAELTALHQRPKGAPETPHTQSAAKEMWVPAKDISMTPKAINLMASRPDFLGEEIEITHVFWYQKGQFSQNHSHMEAVLYILEGEGYSIIDGDKVEWSKGCALHVQGPQTQHQHFPQMETKMIRTHFGIRSRFFQPIAKEAFPYLYFSGPSGD